MQLSGPLSFKLTNFQINYVEHGVWELKLRQDSST